MAKRAFPVWCAASADRAARERHQRLEQQPRQERRAAIGTDDAEAIGVVGVEAVYVAAVRALEPGAKQLLEMRIRGGSTGRVVGEPPTPMCARLTGSPASRQAALKARR